MLGVATTLNIAASDGDGHVWSFLANGPEGFVTRADDKTVYLNRAEMTVPFTLWETVSVGAPIGLVAMDLTSARRFRINGSVRELTPERVTIDVAQTCPNCPKYIQQRLPVAQLRYQDVSPASGSDLPENLADLIRQADTFFVASKHPDGDHDASHRGGYPGFVKVKGKQLIVPDYFGNSMFMTLGNLALEPRAGITFVDFDTGAQLNLTGQTTLNLAGRMAHDGANGRYWTFDIEAWKLAPHCPDPAWKLGGYSRFNPPLET
ncbi:pyridoxamine 5'-phosphate oxidase family protein [Tritonibacter mobilis]|nr:pyridoxamine 5'-phosphate oxidase family protein [Tritonibacter mobilis]